MSWPRPISLFLLAVALLAGAVAALRAQKPEIFPLDQIKPGMKGVGYSIFAGEHSEKFDFEVVGILPNILGPKQDIILVNLHSPETEKSGVVAGMSGSPVYIDGKLAGAVSLKFGIFTKDALAGVTPIENILAIGKGSSSAPDTEKRGVDPEWFEAGRVQYGLPAEYAHHVGLGEGTYLIPIETPLVFSGFYQPALARFRDQFASFGLVATPGGTAAPRPDDAQIQPGDMAAVVLMQGDLSLTGGCTVTARKGNQVFICGHPVLNFGHVAMPMARGHVVTTLSSSFSSTKIMTAGGIIGTITEDKLTGVMGSLGPAPPMIPVELTMKTPAQEKRFAFQVIQHPKLTPLLVAIATYNGLVSNLAYSEGTTLELNGTIDIAGHTPVRVESMFAPMDAPVPDGFPVAIDVQNVFTSIFNNPYEQPKINKVSLRIESTPERRWASIETAWSEKSEVRPGETIHVKALLRPYRGAPYMQEIPITIPDQVSRGNLQILVSDSTTLNRMAQFFVANPQAQLAGLEELIKLVNRERRNDRLYVTLLQPTPTLLVQDKELPNAPLSEIYVLNQARSAGNTMLLWQSKAGEWSVPMHEVVSGQQYLTISVR